MSESEKSENNFPTAAPIKTHKNPQIPVDPGKQ
jgi:hypothetical protein